MKYAVEMASYTMVYILSFMEIGTDVQAILKFGLRNLRYFSVGIIDGRDLPITPLRWAEMP
jgi:hypothetical protein